MEVPEIDPNFEPQQRARSNTWPLRPAKDFIKEEPGSTSGTPPPVAEGEIVDHGLDGTGKDPLGLKQKTSSRRNAWGNLSYADLITKAIQSSADQRLTLSQIYDWMVQNVPYFKDKGDSNSSAGWKNSIRHNLSLHNRFMRIQNEGAGKSSWWVINPDAKPGKSPRRRATSMDTKTYEKKRGRVKKKVDHMRAAMEGHSPNNPGSDFGDGDLGFPDTFNLSPQDFRARTSSNASSIGGRLSPIQSAFEPDLHDSQVPPMSSPIPWNQQVNSNFQGSGQDGFTETLSESLAEMFVGDGGFSTMSPVNNLGVSEQMGGSGNQLSQLSPNNTNNLMPAPPPYQQSPQQTSPVLSTLNNGDLELCNKMNGGSNGLDGVLGRNGGYMNQSLTELLQADTVFTGNGEALMPGQSDPMVSSGVCTPPQFNSVSSSSAFQNSQANMCALQTQNRQPSVMNMPQRAQQLSPLNSSLLRQALTQQKQQQQQQQQQQQFGVQQQPQVPTVQQNSLAQILSSGNGTLSSAMPTNMNTPPNLPYDLDLNITDMQASGIECDVDQIINQELKIDGDLDFNFDYLPPPNSSDNPFNTIQT